MINVGEMSFEHPVAIIQVTNSTGADHDSTSLFPTYETIAIHLALHASRLFSLSHLFFVIIMNHIDAQQIQCPSTSVFS